MLDNMPSMHNIGAAFRIADAFFKSKIYWCGITAPPCLGDIHKTALGGEEIVFWAYAPDRLALLKQLKARGYVGVAVEQTDQGIPLQE